jgi:hypothetical protein
MNMRMFSLKSLAIAPVLGVLAVSNAALSADTTVSADTHVEASRDYSLLDDRFMISLGTFLLTQKTLVTINGTAGNSGTVIDTKKDLGFKDADRFRLDATWRMAEKHKLRAMYFSVSQSSDHVLTRDITVGDTVFHTNVDVTAGQSVDVYELAYEYAFLRRDNYEITASAGVHAMDFGFSLKGVGTVNGVGGQTVHTESRSVTAPLPVVGLRGLWALSPKWYIDAQAQYFQLKIDNVDGEVTDLRAGLTYMFSKHLGVGAGYNRFVTNVGVDRLLFNGDVKWHYSGAQIFVTGSF